MASSSSTATSEVAPVDATALGDALTALRAAQPLVQCLTNIVVSQWTANVLLAAGAAPAMVDNPHEAAGFASISSAVLVNLGTPFDDTAAAMFAAVSSAGEAGVPWVLDPVAGGKGVDSVHAAEDAVEAAKILARRLGAVVAVSGAIDHLTDGERVVKLENGHPLMTQVTGVGCALGALMAAFAGVEKDPLLAAAAATAVLTVAADEAAIHSRGPGSFAVGLLDELSTLTAHHLIERVRVS